MVDKRFTRVFPAVVTPFNTDGSFNFERSKEHLDWMIENGLNGFGILMASGEYQSVTMEEHKAYVKEIVPYLKGRASTIVGVSKERPEDVVELMENVREAGGDAAMVLPSFYYRMDQSELIKHYEYIDSHCDLPILVYNNPFTSSAFEPETLDEICKLDHVKIVKETSGQIDVMTDFIFRKPKDVGIMCGCDYLLYQAYATGAVGWISMTANVLPKLCAQFHNAMLYEHDYAKGLDIYRKLWPVLNVMERFPKPVQAVKYILTDIIGIDEGTVRRPRYELTDEEKQYVREATNIEELLKE